MCGEQAQQQRSEQAHLKRGLNEKSSVQRTKNSTQQFILIFIIMGKPTWICQAGAALLLSYAGNALVLVALFQLFSVLTQGKKPCCSCSETAGSLFCIETVECLRPVLSNSSSSSRTAPGMHVHVHSLTKRSNKHSTQPSLSTFNHLAGNESYRRSLKEAPGSTDAADGRLQESSDDSSSSSRRSSDDAYANARVISMPPPDTHNVVHAITPEAAEAIAYSDPSGIHRLATPGATTQQQGSLAASSVAALL
jgi:hypothetical protein